MLNQLPTFVAKVDPTNSEERHLFRGHDSVPFIQVKYSDSHWLLKEENSIDQLVGPDQGLVLVDWEADEKIQGRHPHDVFQRCIELEEHLDHVYLGDRWTYEKLSPRKNRNAIKRSVRFQRILGEWFREYNVDFEFNPLVLGWDHWHLERQRALVEDFATGLVGFDATGYRSKYQLAYDVNRVIETLDVPAIYVNGRIGPTHLEQLPSEVQAFSGKRALLDEVRRKDGSFSRALLDPRIEHRLRSLDDPQTELRRFTTVTS